MELQAAKTQTAQWACTSQTEERVPQSVAYAPQAFLAKLGRENPVARAHTLLSAAGFATRALMTQFALTPHKHQKDAPLDGNAGEKRHYVLPVLLEKCVAFGAEVYQEVYLK